MTNIVPSPKSLPFFGTLLSLIKEGGGPQLHRYVNKRHQELGPIYKEKIGPVEAYFLKSPSDIQTVFALEGNYPVHVLPECWIKYNDLYGCNRGLYFMDGSEWLNTRKILNRHLLKNFDPQLQLNLTQDLLKTFEQNIVSDEKINNFDSQVCQLSIGFIIAYMLGTPFIRHSPSLSPAIHQLSHIIGDIFQHSVALSLLPISLSVRLKLPAWTSFVRCVQTSMTLSGELCERMHAIGGDGLMAKLSKEGMSDDLIRRIVIDFILAAADTTAVSTQWALYSLARHPSIQSDLFQSLVSTRQPCYQNQLLKQVIRESLRLYPVAPFIGRYLPRDLEIRNYTIPRNSLVLLSVYSSSLDPAYFPSPLEFQPSRWSRDEKHRLSNVCAPYASIPFGAGARSCIGRKLVQAQMCASLAMIINNYKVQVKRPVDVVLKLITVPSEPIQFLIQPRSHRS